MPPILFFEVSMIKKHFVFKIRIDDNLFYYIHSSHEVHSALQDITEIITTKSKTKGKFKKLYRLIETSKQPYLLFLDNTNYLSESDSYNYRTVLKRVMDTHGEKALLNPIPSVVYSIYLMVVHDPITRSKYYYIGKSNNLRTRMTLHKSKLKNGTHSNARLQKLYTSTTKLKHRVLIDNIKDEFEVNRLEFEWTMKARVKYKDKLLNEDNGIKRSEETKRKIKENIQNRNSEEYTNKQAKNNPRSRPITIDGIYYLSIGDAGRKLGVDPTTIHGWIRRGIRDIVLHAGGAASVPRKVTINGVTYPSIMDAHRATGVSRKKLRKIINRH